MTAYSEIEIENTKTNTRLVPKQIHSKLGHRKPVHPITKQKKEEVTRRLKGEGTGVALQ